MIILGIESSCDETSVAVVKNGREVLSNIILSQAEMHAKYGGVVPEIASRAHTEAIYSLCEGAIKKANIDISDISAVAATYAPGLIGALLVGLNFGKALAYRLNLPFVPVNHIMGHIAAAYLEYDACEPPFLAFIASGGHTSILSIQDYTTAEVLGMTRDDAIGEAFDKTARAMGFAYPGGAKIEQCARLGDKKDKEDKEDRKDKNSMKIPVAKVDGSELDFSFSGIKTHVINYINSLTQKNGGLTETDKNNIAAAFTDNVIQSAVSRVKRAIEITGYKALVCAGGVMANGHIRGAFDDLSTRLSIELYIPAIKYCGDNAAMIAAQGFYELQAGNTAALTQNAFATFDF